MPEMEQRRREEKRAKWKRRRRKKTKFKKKQQNPRRSVEPVKALKKKKGKKRTKFSWRKKRNWKHEAGELPPAMKKPKLGLEQSFLNDSRIIPCCEQRKMAWASRIIQNWSQAPSLPRERGPHRCKPSELRNFHNSTQNLGISTIVS